MKSHTSSFWLLATGGLYSVVTFVYMFALAPQPWGVLSLDPVTYAIVMPGTALILALALAAYFRCRWWAVVLFVATLVATASTQLWIFATASAAV